MKKKALLIAGLLGASVAFAQRPEAGDIGVMVGVTGISTIGYTTVGNTGTIVFKYLLAEDMAARIGLNYSSTGAGVANPVFGTASPTTGSGVWESDTTGNGVLTTSDFNHSAWTISLGAQKSFTGGEKVEPYFGADLFVGSTNGKGSIRSEVVTNTGGTIGDYGMAEYTKLNNGFNFGLNLFFGFNYFLAEKFAIGGEFGWGLSKSSTKNGDTTVSSSSGGTVTTMTSTNSATSKTGGFGTRAGGTVTLSVFFN